MMRTPNDNYNFANPMRSPGGYEESVNSDAKKSKNRHLTIINQLRRREDGWDGRFYLNNIPSYRFVDDQHCETYKKMLVKKRNKKFVVKADSKIQTPSDTGFKRRNLEDQSTDSNYRRPDTNERSPMDGRLRGIPSRDIKSREKGRAESMRRYTPMSETLMKEKRAQEERLASLWEKLNVPSFHRETFLRCENLQNVKQTIEILKREADDLESNCSAIQLGLRAITARENCLKQLKILVTKLEKREGGSSSELITEEEAKQKSSELLTHLRILSLNAVETILKWREYIQQAYYITRGVVKANQTIIIPFLYGETNYLIKMKNDIRHLAESPLSKFFNFSSKSDPFLVYPSKENDNPGDKIILYISKNLINRIRACELVILEESVHEHMNDKSGTPISNIKSTTDNNSDRSGPKAEERPVQKSTNIRIRNVGPKTIEKKASLGPQATPSSANKVKTGSHSRLPDSEENVNNKNQPNTEQTKQQEQPKSPIKISPPKRPASRQLESPEKSVKEDYSPDFSPVKESPLKESPIKESSAIKLGQSVVSPVKGASSQHVKPVDIYEDEIESYVEEYLKNVDDNMKNSFLSDPKTLLERANMGQDPTWFKLLNPDDGNNRVGLAITHIDNTVFTTRRMVILHCTLVNRELYAEYLGNLVSYLWAADECNEIKISLYHLEDANNNLGADKELSEAIKKLGFRWKQLTNDKFTGKRYIDYVLKRPEGIVYEGVKTNDEPIHVQSVVVMSDLQGAEEENTTVAHQDMVDNRFAILGAVLKHCDEKIEKLDEGDSKRHKNYLSVVSSLIKEEKSKIGEIVQKFENLDEMVTFVGEKFEKKEDYLPVIDKKYLTNKYTTSLLNLIYRWKSSNITAHKVADKDREYLKINNNKDLVQFGSKYESSSIYFIPTDDNQVNIFLTDNENLVNKIINKEEIIEDVVSKLFSKLEKNPTTFEQDLWVPMFSIHQKNVDLETVKGLIKGEDKVNFAKSTNVIGLNGNKVAGNLKVRPSEKSKIIEKAFLFGIVHEHVDFPLVSVVVKPEDFLEL